MAIQPIKVVPFLVLLVLHLVMNTMAEGSYIAHHHEDLKLLESLSQDMRRDIANIDVELAKLTPEKNRLRSSYGNLNGELSQLKTRNPKTYKEMFSKRNKLYEEAAALNLVIKGFEEEKTALEALLLQVTKSIPQYEKRIKPDSERSNRLLEQYSPHAVALITGAVSDGDDMIPLDPDGEDPQPEAPVRQDPQQPV